MKIKTLKIRLLSVIVGIFLGGCGCYAADNAVKNNIQGVTENMETQHTIITPLLNQNLVEGQNVLWCSTLQLAWNELDTLAGGPIKMEAESPIVAALNQRTATKDEIDAASYLALAGIVGPELLAKIENAQQEKFGGQDLAQDLRSLPQGSLAAYAYLLKTLPFEWAFTRFKTPLRYGNIQVASFGVQQYKPGRAEDDKVAEQVSILDYKSDRDFIIELYTRSKTDKLILAKVAPSSTLDATVREVLNRISQANPTGLQNLESVMIPVINFDLVKNYPELCGRKITANNPEITGKQFSLVTQRIRFTLDERGAVLESKAMFVAAKPPRQLIFDAPFLVMLIRQEAKTPYFALWVANAELLVPF